MEITHVLYVLVIRTDITLILIDKLLPLLEELFN